MQGLDKLNLLMETNREGMGSKDTQVKMITTTGKLG